MFHLLRLLSKINEKTSYIIFECSIKYYDLFITSLYIKLRELTVHISTIGPNTPIQLHDFVINHFPLLADVNRSNLDPPLWKLSAPVAFRTIEVLDADDSRTKRFEHNTRNWTESSSSHHHKSQLLLARTIDNHEIKITCVLSTEQVHFHWINTKNNATMYCHYWYNVGDDVIYYYVIWLSNLAQLLTFLTNPNQYKNK